jgi:predicted RNA-binding protein associated with RNAse of E/G family
VEVVDLDDLAAAVVAGQITPDLAAEAEALAHRLAIALRQGADWRI